MTTSLLSRSSEGLLAFKAGKRMRMVLMLAFVLTYLLGFGYHFYAWQLGEAPGQTLTFFYHLLMLLGYGSLWIVFAQPPKQHRTSAAKSFWVPLVTGLLFVGMGYLITRVGRPAALANLPPGIDVLGFDFETGVPLAVATVFKMNLLSLFNAIFVFVLLARFRDLIMVKRTKSSRRNWYLMLGCMFLASLFEFMKPSSAELSPFQTIAIICTVVFMIVNSLRLSWIVYLSFKEKITSIGLALLLLGILLGIEILDTELVWEWLPGNYTYLKHYSYPLAIFTSQAVLFGILYCTTVLLSLLFHLPTTSDFQQKAGEVAVMHSLTNLVNQVFDSEKLFSTIVASPVQAGSGEASWLAIANPQSGSLRPRIVATHQITAARVNALVDTAALYEDLINSADPLLLDQAPADHRISARPGDGIGSLLAIPLRTRNETVGALFVTKEVTHGFERDDIEAISVFSAQAALALDNARLFEERIEKERLARELSIAREVQLKLLPQSAPTISGVTLAASSVSAQEVGGDYYDFIQLDEHRYAFIIADVSGKGTSAAFYMAEMQGIFHAVSRLAPSPSEFLCLANRALANSLDKNVFISVIYAILDVQEETLTLSRAGHCPAAAIRVSGEAKLLASQGMGLGLDRGNGSLFRKTLAEESIRLQPGDVFALYTDGVVESRNMTGEEYGYERLLEVMRTHRHEDACDLHDHVLNHLNNFIGEKEYDDDLTLVVLKWHGIDLSELAATTTMGQLSHAQAALAPALSQD